MKPGPTARAALVAGGVSGRVHDRRPDVSVRQWPAHGRRPAGVGHRAAGHQRGGDHHDRPADDHHPGDDHHAPPTTKRATEPTLRPAAGVTVQVLNGVWVTGLAHRVAGQVRTAGYDVVAAKTALGSYSVSRVYYTGGHRADAEAFKDRFPAFAVVEPAPPNLSRRVALHVVIGKDYPGV